MRSRVEHREMQWGDIKLQIDSEGQEYLEYSERQTKTRTGVNPRDTRAFMPKAFSNKTDPSKCPVEIYKEYARRRPESFNNADSPFYLGINRKRGASGCWFIKQAMGVNYLANILKNMALSAGFEKKSYKPFSKENNGKAIVRKRCRFKICEGFGRMEEHKLTRFICHRLNLQAT